MTPDLATLDGGRAFGPFFGRIHEIRTDPVDFARRYWTDVEGWAREAIDWSEAPNFAPYQVEAWDALYRFGRSSTRAPRGGGKSFKQAIQVLHFCCTREGGKVPWKTITTAGSWGQLRRYLWPEIHKWARRLRWDRLGFEWRLGRELGNTQIRGKYGMADAAAPTNEALIEGAHEDELFFSFDEAKSIPSRTYDAVEGAFFNIGTRGRKGYWSADSTPGNASGRFFEIHRRKRGLENWWVRHVKPEEAIAAGMLGADIPEKMLALWGPGSRMYRNHVMAEFSDSASDRAVIPLEWAEAAVERGYEWLEHVVPAFTAGHRLDSLEAAGLMQPEKTRLWWEAARPFLPVLSHLGVDIGSGGPGRDPGAIARRHGHIVSPIEVYEGSEIELLGRVVEAWKAPAIVVPDAINAASLVERLAKTIGRTFVAPCNSSLPSGKRDRTGQIEFLNVRSEMWWGVRERLDLAQSPTLILPDDPTLLGELTEPEWEETAGGKVKVEDKKQLAKRVRRQEGREDSGGSTNRADAVAMAFWGGSATGGPARAITPRAQPGMGF